MATLTGNKIKDSYLGLLKSIDNAPFSPRAAGTFVQISDGGGNSLPLYLAVNAIRFYNAYTFPSADGTVDGQVLSTDANGTLSWVTSSDNQTLEEVLTQGNTTTIAISSSANITTTAQFEGDINGALLQKVIAAEALSKGDVVYISGGTGDNPEVSKAKADSITTMPSLGIMKENLSLNSEGECITSGELTGLATLLGSFSTGDDLYVSSSTAGALQNTAPTGEANLIQKIGKVIKGGNGGALTVLGAFRTNAVPNLDSAKIFLGNASNEAVSTAISGDATISDTGVIALATVPVTKGGTGATTLTGILLGNATSAISGITSAVDGHVLTADGNGGYDFEVASGDVSISGTPTTNQVAIWTDGSTIKGMSALEIDVNDKITLDQDASSYNIGGGNIANVTGTNNTGFGLENLNVVTSGDGNVAIGYRALKSLTIGGSNTAIGYNSLEFLSNLVDGHNGNTAVGLSSGRRNNGGFNTFIGFQSGQGSINTSNNNSFNNTALGYFSLNKLTSGNSNTGVGSSALEDNTTGVLNTCLGQGSGREITTGSKNVILGSFTGFSGGTDIRTSDNNIIISDGSGNNRIQVDSGGIVGIGSTGIFAGTNAILNLQGSGIALKNDRNGSNNNWSYIQNDGTGNESTIILSTGNAIPAMKLAHNGNVGIGVAPNATTKVEVNIINSSNITAVPPLLTLKNVGAAHVAKFVLGDGTTSDTFITHTGGNSVADQKFGIGINATNKFVLDGNGNVGIGTDSPSSKLDITATRTAQLTLIELSTNTLSSGVDDEISIDFGRGLLDKYSARISGYISNFSTYDGGLKFYTSSGGTLNTTPQLTISSGGAASFSGSVTADGGMVINGNAGLTANNYGSGKNSSFLSSHASQPQGILIHYTAASPNATGNLFIECKDTSTQRFTVRSNGGVANYSGNNVNLSDESVKKNITDTPNSLDIIKNLEVKDFQYIDQTDNKIHTGVIAQQVLKTDPSLVDQSEELKMVYNTDLMFKMLKAIQEQQTIIEDLKSRIETLEG